MERNLKESIVLLLSFIVYIFIFKITKLYTVELRANLVIMFSFLTAFFIFLDYRKIKIIKDLYFIKYIVIENIVLFLACFVFSFFMSNYLGYTFFYHFNDLVLFSPLIILFSVFLSFLGYREKSDLFLFSNKWFYIRKFVLKILFIPYIYGVIFETLNKILVIDSFYFRDIDYYFFLFGLLVDVAIGLFGYVFSSHLLKNEIKSVDGSVKGWLICMICYNPLLYFYEVFFSQVDNYTWKDWAVGEWYYYPWLALIVISWLIYSFSTYAFGFKFSNLTWRGLINTGTYHYVKHPAYLSKNIYWWLYTVPLFGVYGWDILNNVIALLVFNLIYYARAKTEEQHLMQFAEYREYNEWIKQNGLWAKFKKIWH